MEKGFRGRHFEHISGFEGEREILGGIPGYFPDFKRIWAGKWILSRVRDREMVAKLFMYTRECGG